MKNSFNEAWQHNVKTYTDSTNPNLIYIWYAIFDTLTSHWGWRIKVIENIWAITQEKYPLLNSKASNDFSFVWDDRATYTYQ